MEDIVKPRLLDGERIAWEGQPYFGLILRPIELFLIPFSLLWGGFALFWNASVWTTNADLSFKLFGIPFFVAGIYITVGRFLLDMRIRKKWSTSLRTSAYSLRSGAGRKQRLSTSTAFLHLSLTSYGMGPARSALEAREDGSAGTISAFGSRYSILHPNSFGSQTFDLYMN